jgi:gamma-glutamylcysteine synthetase
MTDVRNDDFTLIRSIDDVIPLYRGNGQQEHEQYIGFETEIFVYRKGADGQPVAASSRDCAQIVEHLKSRGLEPQLEMASAVEYASPAYPVTQVAKLNADIARAWKDYTQGIREAGFQTNDAALAPFVTLDSAKDNLVDRDRARGLVKGMDLFKAPEFLKVTLLCTSTQVSLSYASPDDLRSTLATGYALNGAIFGVFANYPAFIEGQDERLQTNPRAAFYDAFGKDGGIPDSLLQSKDGDDFIRRHAEQVFKTDMLFYYDQKQNLVWPEKPVKFEELEKIGLNTRSNYDLAETFVYTDFKVCNIRNSAGVPIGKRLEVRGFDAGETGALAAVPFCHALLRDAVGRDAVQGLLADYGLLPDQDSWQDRLKAARHSAAHHGGKFLDVPFGTRPDGTDGNLKDFARDLGKILKAYTARNPELAAALAPVITICETGKPQAQIKSEQTRNYTHAVAQLVTANDDAQTPAKKPAATARQAFRP